MSELILHPLGTADLIKFHLSVQIIALRGLIILKSKTKYKIQKGEMVTWPTTIITLFEQALNSQPSVPRDGLNASSMTLSKGYWPRIQ